MDRQSKLARAVAQAKRDEWSKARGGFCVVRLSNGETTYFLAGDVPAIAGEADKGAEIVGKWRWAGQRWSRID